MGGGEKKRSGTYDFFVGLRRSAFFWRLAAPLVIDYARFLTKINALDTSESPIASLGLNSYNWWSEATHGISHVANNPSKGTRYETNVSP